MKKIKKPDPIEIEAPDKQGSTVTLRTEFVSNEAVDAMGDKLDSGEYSKTPGMSVAETVASIFGKDAKYYHENFDNRVLNDILNAFREEYRADPTETQDT